MSVSSQTLRDRLPQNDGRVRYANFGFGMTREDAAQDKAVGLNTYFELTTSSGPALIRDAGMLNYVVTKRLLGAVALGLYPQAFNLGSWPVNVFSLIVRRVSLVAFSRVQHDPAQRQATLVRMAVLLAIPTLPACVLLGLLALPLVTTVYAPGGRALRRRCSSSRCSARSACSPSSATTTWSPSADRRPRCGRRAAGSPRSPRHCLPGRCSTASGES